MTVRFFVPGIGGAIEAEMDGERDTMTAYRLHLGDNQSKANEYARGIAAEMTTLYNAGQEEQAITLFGEAEAKLNQAQLDETSLIAVRF